MPILARLWGRVTQPPFRNDLTASGLKNYTAIIYLTPATHTAASFVAWEHDSDANVPTGLYAFVGSPRTGMIPFFTVDEVTEYKFSGWNNYPAVSRTSTWLLRAHQVKSSTLKCRWRRKVPMPCVCILFLSLPDVEEIHRNSIPPPPSCGILSVCNHEKGDTLPGRDVTVHNKKNTAANPKRSSCIR